MVWLIICPGSRSLLSFYNEEQPEWMVEGELDGVRKNLLSTQICGMVTHCVCKCCNENTKQILVRKIKKLLIGSHLTMMRVVSCRCPLHLWKVEVTSMTGLGTGLRRRCSKIIIQHLRIPTLEFLFPMGSRVTFQIADRSQCQRIAAKQCLVSRLKLTREVRQIECTPHHPGCTVRDQNA